jgi:hypothetical protein
MTGRAITLAFVLALVASAACGSSSEGDLYSGGGTKPGVDASTGGSAGTTASGGAAGIRASGGSAGTIASGGSAGTVERDATVVDAPPDVPILPSDAGPDGNDPVACPPTMPAPGAACNIFVNVTDCVYGFKHCVCTVTTWLCVP